MVSIDKSSLKWIEEREEFSVNSTERFTVAEFFRDLYMREKTVPVVEDIYWAADTPETEKKTVQLWLSTVE